MQYTQTSEQNLPIDLDTAKDWLRVTHDFEDAKISAILSAAFSFAESYTGQSFHSQGWTAYASASEVYNGIEITKAPISAFGIVKMNRNDGDPIMLTDRDYMITVDSSRAFFFIRSMHLFDQVDDSPYAFEINFETSAGLPPHVANAIKMTVAFMYENAGDAPTVNNNSAPPEALKLLQLERVGFV